MSHPESRFRAEFQGEEISPWHWPHVPQMLADIYDMETALLRVLAGAESGAEHMYPRPERRHAAERTPTVAEFDVAGFMRQINS